MRTEKMTQSQRLDYLVEKFKTDSVQYKDLKTPKDTEGKRRILRSLIFNVFKDEDKKYYEELIR